MNNSVREIYEYGKAYLSEAGVENAPLEASEMCRKALEIGKTEFLLYPEAEVEDGRREAFLSMLSRRASGEPLQYVLGEWTFFGRSFAVGEGVLIPRPETEQLVEICIDKIKAKKSRTVYDLCAGTGCIGITVGLACPDTDVYLFELFDGAFSFLEKNAETYNDGNLHLVRCDIINGCPTLLPLPDVIISNPPYIPKGELRNLQREVLREPLTALDGGEDGLDFYRAIEQKWLPLLSDGGFAAVEVGEKQGDIIAEIFSRHGKSETITDFYGTKRFVISEKGEK